MSVIEASSVTVKTMADNTLRLTVDIEPRFAKQAFALFGERGTPMALAALKAGAQPEPEPEKPKGGYAAKWLALRDQEPAFHEFLEAQFGAPSKDYPAKDFVQLVRDVCGVTSRAHIDHNRVARDRFHKLIRLPYQRWCAVNGVTAPEVVEA